MAKQSVTEKSLKVLNYLKEHADEQLTAADIAEQFGLEPKSITGTINAGLIRNKGLAVKIPGSIQLEDGTYKNVSFYKISEKGLAYNHEEAIAADAAAAASPKDEDEE